MTKISVENYGLTPMSQNEKSNYSGGGVFDFFDTIGYISGAFVAISIKAMTTVAKDILISQVKR